MTLYELVNPSDAISFYADEDIIAIYCVLILGRGQLLTKRADGNELNPKEPFLLFASEEDVKTALNETFGDSEDFHSQNIEKIIRCFESFQNESVHTRQTIDAAASYITDPEKLKEFWAQHEEQHRSSVNTYVQNAWRMAEKYAQNHKS